MPSASERVIVALDVAGLTAARELVKRVPAVRFWKVGLELFIAAGPVVVSELKAQGHRVFLDLKLHDIPNTVAGACRSAVRLGVDLLTVHAAGGAEMMMAAHDATVAESAHLGIQAPALLAVTLLTSLDQAALARLQVSVRLDDYIEKLTGLALTNGIGGIVCSPREAAHLRSMFGDNFLIVTPGIRPGGTDSHEQRRTLTPAEAIRGGADYLVIGRPVTESPDPNGAFLKIVEEISA